MWWPGKRSKALLTEIQHVRREMRLFQNVVQLQGDQIMATLETVKVQAVRLEAAVAKAVERLGQLADPVAFQDLEDRLRVANDALEAKVAETDPAPPPPPPPVELPPVT